MSTNFTVRQAIDPCFAGTRQYGFWYAVVTTDWALYLRADGTVKNGIAGDGHPDGWFSSKHEVRKAMVLYERNCQAPSNDAAELSRLRQLEAQVQSLIAESEGVVGLHRNEEIATWNWLTEAGSWLDAINSPETSTEHHS